MVVYLLDSMTKGKTSIWPLEIFHTYCSQALPTAPVLESLYFTTYTLRLSRQHLVNPKRFAEAVSSLIKSIHYT